ncbi:MAG: hypothetical protein EXR59_04635 [Dehalococcoidia bacterium]|nr:hypothetical protein [Dehalococcoidia bacterium]
MWLWPAVFIGAFVANITTQGNILTSLGIAAGNTLEAVTAVWLVNKFANDKLFYCKAVRGCENGK